MKHFLPLALLVSPIPATAVAASPTVEVANGNWSYLPLLKQRSNFQLSSKVIYRLHEIANERRCTHPAFGTGGTLDFDLSFAAHYNPDGTLNRIVLPKLDCPEAEGILGGALLKMMQKGDYRPDGSNQDGWYQGKLSFTVSG